MIPSMGRCPKWPFSACARDGAGPRGHAVPCTQLFQIVGGPRGRCSQPTSADQGRPVLHGAQGGGGVARGLHAAPEGEGGGMGLGRGRAFSYIGPPACPALGPAGLETATAKIGLSEDSFYRIWCPGSCVAGEQCAQHSRPVDGLAWSALRQQSLLDARGRIGRPAGGAPPNSVLRAAPWAAVWPWLQARCPPRCGPCTSSTGSRQSPSGSSCAWGISRLVVTQEHRRQCRPAL